MPPRPGPLHDLPLERFIDIPFPPAPTTPQQTYKRPPSSGTPNLFSPTKRRILAQEGVFSPEKTVKSTIARSDRALAIRGIQRQGLARKLDFGQSPRNGGNVVSTSCLFGDYFAEPAPELSPPSRRCDHHHSLLPILDASSSRLPPILPSSPNPQINVHYPGFDVWTDRDLAPSSLSSYSSLDDPHTSDEDKENSYDDKENVHSRPKRRSGLSKRMKSVSFASPERARRPNTPKIPFTPLNARSPLKVRLPRELTPVKAMDVDKDEMKWRRDLLAMELDGDDDSDDEL